MVSNGRKFHPCRPTSKILSISYPSFLNSSVIYLADEELGEQRQDDGKTAPFLDLIMLLHITQQDTRYYNYAELEQQDLIFPLELSRKCTDQWKPDSRTLDSQEHPQGSKRDATEKEEENVIESSMSSELSELSLRSEDDAGK